MRQRWDRARWEMRRGLGEVIYWNTVPALFRLSHSQSRHPLRVLCGSAGVRGVSFIGDHEVLKNNCCCILGHVDINADNSVDVYFPSTDSFPSLKVEPSENVFDS